MPQIPEGETAHGHEQKMLSKATKVVPPQPYNRIGNAAMLQLMDGSTRTPIIQLTAKEANPNTRARYHTAHASKAAGVSEIQNKSGPGHLTGTPPGTANPVGWNTIPAQARGLWIRFHMINQQVGGLGQNNNLVPTSQATNQDPFWQKFEKDAQNEYNAGKWIWCKVEVTDYHAANPGFPRRIEGLLESYDPDIYGWEYVNDVNLTIAVPPNFQTGVIELGNMNANDWQRIFNAPYVTRTHMSLAILFQDQHYTSYDAFYADLFSENAPDISNTEPIEDAVIGRYQTLNINIFDLN